MKFIKGFFKWLLIILLLANAYLLISGNTHLYKAVALTYLKGRTGPDIDDYKSFANREIKTGAYQPWAVGSRYNKEPLKNHYTQYHQNLGTVAFLVIKNDSVLHESYWEGYDSNSYSNSFSMAKSIVSVLVGCAIGDGLVKDENEPVAKYLPEYREVTGDSVTIRHLLIMSSGINFDESYGNPVGMMAKAYYGGGLKELVKGYHPTQPPGKEFDYLGGNTLLLGFLVEKVTGKKLGDYASEKIWQPVGAKNPALWTIDGDGGDERSYCCFYSNARDFARIGKLYLDSGRWNGRQLVPQQYVLSSVTPATDYPDRTYGYQWWCMNRNGEKIFYARGILGQYIIVRPEKKEIIVRLGHKREMRKINGHPADVEQYIAMADDMK